MWVNIGLTLVVYLVMSAATSAEAGGVRKSPDRLEADVPEPMLTGEVSLSWTAGETREGFNANQYYMGSEQIELHNVDHHRK